MAIPFLRAARRSLSGFPLLLICKPVPCFKNSRKLKVVQIRHILHYSKRVCLIYFKTFKTSQFPYLSPLPISTTHNLYNKSMSKTAMIQLEIRSGGVVEETGAKNNTETNKESQFVKAT